MSAPEHGPVHLVALDTALDEFRRDGAYMAVCGALLPGAGLPSWECPEGCDSQCLLHCPECVRVLAEAERADRAGADR